MRPPIIIPTVGVNHTATLIFLHQLGSTALMWSVVLPKVRPKYMKIICPIAKVIPITFRSMMTTPAWFNEKHINRYIDEDIDRINRSSVYVHHLIDQEIKSGIPPERIIVGGFGQGGAVALFSGLSYRKPIGAIVAMSAWLPLHNDTTKFINPANRKVPILQIHGILDEVVIHNYGEHCAYILGNLSHNIIFKSIPATGHTATKDVMGNVSLFLTERFGPV